MSATKLGTEDVTSSDMISHLPDDLLVQILSLVPISEAMNTSLISRRWESLWKMMSVLEYVEKSCPNMTSHGFVEFCRRSLQLHEAPVLKTLTIKQKEQYPRILLPSSFHETVFQKLVFLKRLHLKRVRFRDEQSFCMLISACPVLEDLFLDNVSICAGRPFFPPLTQKRLEINNAPSLNHLNIKYFSGRLIFTNDMPNLVEATLRVRPRQSKDFLRLKDPPPSVCNPSSVPECLSFYLQTFQWTCYNGTMEEKEVVRYILQNGRCLKTAEIVCSIDLRRDEKKELLMIKELKSMPKASTSCQLVTWRFT